MPRSPLFASFVHPRPVIEIPLPYHRDGQYYCDRLDPLPGFVWLDSGTLGGEHARYDIFSALPSHTVSGTASAEQINQRLLTAPAQRSDLPFCGGWIGYFGYQARHRQFGLVSRSDYTCPDQWFGWYDCALIQDHLQKKARLVVTETCPANTRQQLEAAIAGPGKQHPFSCSHFQHDQSKFRYLQDLQSIQNYIAAGDCYQTNYTQRFSADFSGSTAAAYCSLRRAVPSPFAAYLKLPGGQTMLSISPERFIRIDGRQAMTQPIKGTVRRSANPEEDGQLRAELSASEKNRAENLMIVDLLRNDFNQTCLPHSVRVPKLFELQSFANVHHLVSTVTGELPADADHYAFLLSCFPGGSITGAPKKRAMEVIDELEVHGRGVYCGAIGYMSAHGRSDFNIAIRTFYVEAQRIYCWAGGGIVADSDAEAEYQESLLKVGALLQALAPSH